MAIGTALGFSDWGTVALAVALAFVFGYSLTSLPLLRAGLALATVVPIALASDTASIAVMEIVDNAIIVVIPGALEAELGDILFWGSLAFSLVVAGFVALPLNRWLIARGKGHAVVHETGIHGGPSPRVVGRSPRSPGCSAPPSCSASCSPSRCRGARGPRRAPCAPRPPCSRRPTGPIHRRRRAARGCRAAAPRPLRHRGASW